MDTLTFELAIQKLAASSCVLPRWYLALDSISVTDARYQTAVVLLFCMYIPTPVLNARRRTERFHIRRDNFINEPIYHYHSLGTRNMSRARCGARVILTNCTHSFSSVTTTSTLEI